MTKAHDGERDDDGAGAISKTQTAPTKARPPAHGRVTAVRAAPAPGAIELRGDADGPWDPEQRYERRELLGAGGMGEVELHEDAWIGREVALKTLRPARAESAAARRRFFQEMQVQGQLEHPAIVPVYDFGADADGTLHFTMRRVRGPTLKQILKGLVAGDAEMRRRFSRRKLLTAFVSVCLAVHYAHTRGVLHRDLKPSNVMLGEFGEVYVLDWGVAKVVESWHAASEAPLTQEGAIVGTPAYMAPEQLLRAAELDARTDVYALGVILYELLATRPLHQGRDTPAIIDATLLGLDRRPSATAADVAPELDAICVRATALDAAARFATAQEMADAIERYLDGDRDLERRRAVAVEHAARAEAAALRATTPGATDEDHEAARAEAMRETIAALTFDQAQPDAARTLVELLVKVPERLPAEVEVELERSTEGSRRTASRYALFTFLFWLTVFPTGLLLGVRSMAIWGLSIATSLCGVLYAWVSLRRGGLAPRHVYVLAVLSALTMASTAAWLGPFVHTPTCAAVTTLLAATICMKRERPAIIGIGVLAALLPFALEWLHVVPPSFAFEAGRVVLFPRGYDLSPTRTLVCLVYVTATWVLLPSLLMGRLRDGFARAERELFLHAWHFRRLLPAAPRAPARG